jgi:hypothetical protein
MINRIHADSERRPEDRLVEPDHTRNFVDNRLERIPATSMKATMHCRSSLCRWRNEEVRELMPRCEISANGPVPSHIYHCEKG